MLKRIAIFMTLLGCVCGAYAQDLYHRPSPLAGRTMLSLATFDEVKTELKLTPEQNGVAEDLLSKLGDDLKDAFQNSNGDFEAMQDTLTKATTKYDDQFIQKLKPEQAARLKELFIQYNEAGAIQTDSITKDVGLTDDQKTKMKQIQKESRQQVFDLFQQGLSQEDMRAAMDKNHKDLVASLDKLLTDDQKKKLKDMEGAKFEFKKEA